MIWQWETGCAHAGPLRSFPAAAKFLVRLRCTTGSRARRLVTRPILLKSRRELPAWRLNITLRKKSWRELRHNLRRRRMLPTKARQRFRAPTKSVSNSSQLSSAAKHCLEMLDEDKPDIANFRGPLTNIVAHGRQALDVIARIRSSQN